MTLVPQPGPEPSSRELAGDGTQLTTDRVVFTEGIVTFTMLSPDGFKAPVTVRCISGVCTLAPTSGTLEVTELNVGESATLAPRPSDNSIRLI